MNNGKPFDTSYASTPALRQGTNMAAVLTPNFLTPAIFLWHLRLSMVRLKKTLQHGAHKCHVILHTLPLTPYYCHLPQTQTRLPTPLTPYYSHLPQAQTWLPTLG